MGKGFKAGGGGSNPLNFKVVGGTSEPANPKENMIWINTDKAITRWDFSATEPQKVSGNRNLLVYPYSQTTRSASGITCTDNGDGSITVNGTATARVTFMIREKLILPSGSYVLSGCPAGGSFSAHVLTFGGASSCTDLGEAKAFTLTEPTTKAVYIRIESGAVLNNLVFKPQLEKGSTATSFVKGDATGQVWISVGTNSGVAFNALKKNGIQVYPISAKQYISGAWVDKTTKSYQGGEWVDWWNGELYKLGNEYEAVTGGWKVIPNNGYSVSLTKNASTMKLTTNSAEWSGLIGIKNTSPMDLRGFNTMRVVIKAGSCTDSVTHGFGIVNNYNFADFSTAWTAKGTFKGAGTYDLNISSISSGLPLLQSVVSGSFEVEQILLL